MGSVMFVSSSSSLTSFVCTNLAKMPISVESPHTLKSHIIIKTCTSLSSDPSLLQCYPLLPLSRRSQRKKTYPWDEDYYRHSKFEFMGFHGHLGPNGEKDFK